MKVLICGDRNWTDRNAIRAWVEKLVDWNTTEIIEGEAKGADTLAREEAESVGIKVSRFPADWGKFGRAAGPIRNRQMLDQKPDLVIAFHNALSESHGTLDCLKEACRRNIICVIYPESEKNRSKLESLKMVSGIKQDSL